MSDTPNPQRPEHESVGVGLQTESFEFIAYTPTGRIFRFIVRFPKTVIAVGLLLILITGAFLPITFKDISAEAFIDPENPVIEYNNRIEELFGLSDPVIVAIVSDDPEGIFTPRGLNLVASVTDQIRKLPEIDPDRVTSLATESAIIGDKEGMEIEPFIEGEIEDDEHAQWVRDAVFDMPLFRGTLVANDGSAAMIIAELVDGGSGAQAFHDIEAIAMSVESNVETLHIAGEGAISEYLGEYIDNDARRLYPIVLLTIIGVLIVAYRTPRGVFIPLTVVVGAVVIATGTMAGFRVPFYLITNALPVVLIAIGVADGVHIVGQYYEQLALRPYSNSKEASVRAMVGLWHAILFTSVTDCVGFLALAAASIGPPMRAFGLFAALGVAAVGIFSLFVIPALLTLIKPKQSPAFKHHPGKGGPEYFDVYGRLMGHVGRAVTAFPLAIVVAGIALGILGIFGATQLQIDYDRLRNFQEDEPIRIAANIVNEKFNGTGFIDVVVETDESEALTNPEYLKKIEDLQEHVEAMEHVGGSTSIADYVKQLHRAFNEGDPRYYTLPETDFQVAQFFLLLSTASDPDILEQVVDYEYRLANVRISMTSSQYTHIKPVVEDLQQYIDEVFAEPGLRATIAGRNNLNYHWINGLTVSHFSGVSAALAAILIVTALSFRSLVAGIFVTTPVVISTLTIYAAMGFFGIWLDVGGSMFASIAIGISVNFAIHTLERMIELVRDYGEDVGSAISKLFPSTGRALLFNFIAVFMGFGVLLFSKVTPLYNFGLLVAFAVLISFVASITLLPAMLLVFKPKFLNPKNEKPQAAEDIEITLEEW